MEINKIEELKKILYSKIDQLSTLIGDNFKTVHYDYFKINSGNLDEKIGQIKDIINSDNKKELEVLVMKKNIIKLTEDFLDKEIFEDINKEKKKLRRNRYIFLILIFLLTVIGIGIYGNIIYKIIQKVNNTKQPCIVSSKTGSVSTLSGNDLTSSKTGSVSTLSGNDLTSSKTGSISNISGSNLISSNSGYVKTETGNYIFGVLSKKEISSGTIIKGTVKVIKLIKNNTIKLKGFNTGYNLLKNTYIMLKYKGNYQMTGDNIFSGEYQIRGTLEKNIILGNVLTGNFILPKKKKILDKNEIILKGKELQKYKKEKKIKCPYNGQIKVNVRALNLRTDNTKYSKKLGLLWKGTKLKVLTCQKNLEADSWWYKVKTRDGKTGWVSTIGVGK